MKLQLADLRRWWLKIHRWLGLGLGWVLIVAGLTGALLAVARPLDQHLHPELFRARSGAQACAAPVPLETLAARVRGEFGARTGFTFRFPHEPGESLWLLVRGPWTGTLYVDPCTGDEQGRRGESEGFVNIAFELHSALLMDEAGKKVLAWSALAYLLLLASGLVLWWPRRWPPALRIEWRAGWPRAMLDLHRTGGALLGVLIAVSVVSGAYMAWRPLGEVLNWASGRMQVKAPVLPRQEDSGKGLVMSVDELSARALAVFPGALPGYVMMPAGSDKPVRVRLRLPDDPHPNGISSVWLHPRTGAVLASYRWNELDPGTGIAAVVYPLHTGELGGPALQALVAAGGLCLAGLGAAGLLTWWRRRMVRPRPSSSLPSSRPSRDRREPPAGRATEPWQ